MQNGDRWRILGLVLLVNYHTTVITQQTEGSMRVKMADDDDNRPFDCDDCFLRVTQSNLGPHDGYNLDLPLHASVSSLPTSGLLIMLWSHDVIVWAHETRANRTWVV